ncbi:hypothetical protein ACFCYB_34165 [Streptomyces sp. NPDC056309]|uniref:hypothetical protein n=1 Tax=unclassified Streptomyces TaxID=2593676 RepID=UPI0035DD58C5
MHASRDAAGERLRAGRGATAGVDQWRWALRRKAGTDIAAVASETLLDPGAHAGARYTLTGPQALTPYNDIDQEAWVNGALAAGVPADWAVMLRWLTGAIITGNGSMPTDDIEKVTGRPPTAFREFAERNAHAWTSEGK